MPFRKFNKKTRRPRRNLYGTKPRFMPRTLARKKFNQIGTKTFYFKGNGQVGADAATGTGLAAWGTRIRVTPLPPGTPYFTPGVPADFLRCSRLYAEYKILSIKLNLYPANVGTEDNLPGVSVNPWQRGNVVTYIEQSLSQSQQLPTTINQVMNLGSAMMTVPRRRHTRILYRPKGYPEWGQCDSDIPQSQWRLDPWWGSIFWLLNGSTPGGPPVSFYKVTYKVIFRGRSKAPGGGVTVNIGETDPTITMGLSLASPRPPAP